MTNRIFRSIFLATFVSLMASFALITGVLYNHFTSLTLNQLKADEMFISAGLAARGKGYLERLDVERFRITWIDQAGKVIYDSSVNDTANLENHLEREEIKEALQSGSGESKRYSATLLQQSLYVAKRMEDGTILRISTSQSTALSLVLGITQPILIVLMIGLIVSLIIAGRLAKNIVKPLNEINLDDPNDDEGYDELSPILTKINHQKKELHVRKTELEKKQNQFDTITKNLEEGMILLNPTGDILSINQSAKRILDIDRDCIGENMLRVHRNMKLQSLVDEALSGMKKETVWEIDKGIYQFNVSPIIHEEKVQAVSVLLFDITEQRQAEQIRREFSANVSHELKTPLHVISGYAELMKDGVAKDGNVQLFSQRIYAEAQRMKRLVENIIYLSHLDEAAGDMRFEKIDLLQQAYTVEKELTDVAGQAEVTMHVSGEPLAVYANPSLIHSVLYNLSDNAIKYNRKNGKVDIRIVRNMNTATICVSDTGVGISDEDRARIFERFYRVDKSHSKKTGGTGLGLSIVKHAVLIHHGTIRVEKNDFGGCDFIVTLPLSKS